MEQQILDGYEQGATFLYQAGCHPRDQQLSQRPPIFPTDSDIYTPALSSHQDASSARPEYCSPYMAPPMPQQALAQPLLAINGPLPHQRQPHYPLPSSGPSTIAGHRLDDETEARFRAQQPAGEQSVPVAYEAGYEQAATMPWPSTLPAAQPSTHPSEDVGCIRISSLLSGVPEHARTSRAPQAPRLLESPVAVPLKTGGPGYSLNIRQQPFAARSCGFGDRDRRVIDPPPIVQLTIDDPGQPPEEVRRQMRHPFSVVHCTLWDESGTRDVSSMPENLRQLKRLMGTDVASPFVGLDENGEEGCFFCFPDLSCRTSGPFRLKFALVVLDPTLMRPGTRSEVVATVMSDVFRVYNAKEFPGMRPSTPLTKRLREQGCLISVKKGNSTSRGRGESPDAIADIRSKDNDMQPFPPKRRKQSQKG